MAHKNKQTYWPVIHYKRALNEFVVSDFLPLVKESHEIIVGSKILYQFSNESQRVRFSGKSKFNSREAFKAFLIERAPRDFKRRSHCFSGEDPLAIQVKVEVTIAKKSLGAQKSTDTDASKGGANSSIMKRISMFFKSKHHHSTADKSDEDKQSSFKPK